MIQRMIGAAFLKTEVYQEVEADESLTQEALMVVVLIAALNGVIGFVLQLILGSGFGTALISLVWGVVWAIVGYFIYAYLAYWIGTSLFQGTATVGELRRTLGYAYTPMILGSIRVV